ncbi:MAG: formylglycine-generating enzyme family protein [Planctomycetaceae bacterium]|jgi:formylglycine-generating enzyme required for sulfatase activity|nr:formylglycine-generating enzyme family protein [Planctomycetaceae bacterium]
MKKNDKFVYGFFVSVFLVVFLIFSGCGSVERGGESGNQKATANPPNTDANNIDKGKSKPKREVVSRDNPLFKSTLEYIKSPVPLADSEAADAAGMRGYVERIGGSEVSFKMVPIRGGKFLMGSPSGEVGRSADESPQVEVEVGSFWMEEHEVTWQEFGLFALKILRSMRKPLTEREELADALASPTPPHTIGAISYDNSGKIGYPASGMTLYMAQVYCKWLTVQTGRFYRLPTEAEWEYACRAGAGTAYSFGETDELIDEYAWYFDNSGGVSKKVMQKKPNAWGLYDMHGNLSEWVLEQYAPDTYIKRKDNSAKPVKIPVAVDFGQVLRGGNCEDDETVKLRSAARLFSVSEWKRQDPIVPQSIWWTTDAPYTGFRIVRPLNLPKSEEELKLYEPDPEIWLNYPIR